jgi:hypothetical protein
VALVVPDEVVEVAADLVGGLVVHGEVRPTTCGTIAGRSERWICRATRRSRSSCSFCASCDCDPRGVDRQRGLVRHGLQQVDVVLAEHRGLALDVDDAVVRELW